ncbi:MAG: hypothetical protein HFJ75_08945 [Eggerthellaceae bacterium]|nr:hypothetical protein [Eggerthellaceae bacterium]
MERSVQGRRAVRAAVAVCVALAAVAVAAGASGGGEESRGAPAVGSGPAALARAALGGEEEWARALPGYAVGAVAPPWFVEEVFDPVGAAESYGEPDSSVRAFVYGADVAATQERVAGDLAVRGWRAVPSGLAGSLTLVKDEGTCRWALVSWIEQEHGACVVVQTRRVGGR